MPSSIELLQRRAEKGDEEAQFHLALAFHEHGNFEQAMRWYELAAKKGHAFAQNNLGLIYQTGTWGSQDLDQAAHHFAVAANLGLKEGQYNLGVLFMTGKGAHLNPVEGAQWLSKSADQGYWRAQFELGRALQMGAGVERDCEKAAEIFKKAYLGRPATISTEDRINERYALITTPGGESSFIPRFTPEPQPTDPGLALIERCAGFPGVPNFTLFSAARKARLIKHAQGVVARYKEALETFGRDMLGTNRPLSGLDWKYADFLRALALTEPDQKSGILFRSRELIYQAALEKKLEFFRRISQATKETGENQVILKRLQFALISEWISPQQNSLPLCFFTAKAIQEYFNNPRWTESKIQETRKALGLMNFTELWFHVPGVTRDATSIRPTVSDARRGHARKTGP